MRIYLRALQLLFLVGLSGLPVSAATVTFADRVVAIAEAEAGELDTLAAAMAEAASQSELVSLQRCASYVKLSSRHALCQAQLDLTPLNPATAARLTATVEELETRLAALFPSLPDGYRFAPLGNTGAEVPACDE